MSASDLAATPPPELKARILAAVREEPSSTRREARKQARIQALARPGKPSSASSVDGSRRTP